MQRIFSSLIVLGMVFSVQVGAESMMVGQVRLASGESVAGAQVRLFDLRDLRSWVGATTDETGSFALPLGALPGAAVQPAQFSLGSNYPNPFNPATVIPYRLQQPMLVRLEVFNVLGQHIATLVDGQQSEGFYTARWDGTDAAGAAVAAGVYLYRLSGEGVQATRSMVLIDGQAGIPAGSSGRMPQAGAEAMEAASVYGLTVSGPGLMPFVDPAFRVAAGPVDLVVEASAGMARAKTALSGSCFSGGVLGDVDNNGRVDFFDALLVALYSEDTSTIMPNNGDISLGDVNADGRIDFADAYLIAGWLNDSADPTLPAGIGEGGGVASPDCAALVALYEATGGDNWTDNANWLSDAPLGEWFGVTTDDEGRVTYLELGGNALSGTLPSELGNLTNLQELYLYENELSGGLPAWLGDLTHLRELDLYDNDFSGSLPESLSNLTNLEVLYLDRNQLSGPLPGSLVKLTRLKWLNLRNTELCAPTDDVFQGWLDGIENKRGVVNCGDSNPDRAALVALYEATNGANWTDNTNWLSDRPLDEWYGVTTNADGRVTRLMVNDNGLSGSLPTSLGDLKSLEWLNLGNNKLSGALPASLGGLTRLQLLALQSNQFSGELPPSLGNLTDLRLMQLSNNALTGALPDLLVRLTKLAGLWLDGTRLCAPTDAAFQAWLEGIENKVGVVNCGDSNPDRAALVALYEATDGGNWTDNTNWLSDRPLGEWFGVTTDRNGRVIDLRLNDNSLSGTLPPELGDLTHLQWLSLGINQLSGALPPELGNLTNLQVLSLYANQLSGALPPELGNLTHLQWLSLGLNELLGELPRSLVNLTNLTWLNLENTQLCAPLDIDFQAWLEGIDIKQGVVNCGDPEPPSTAIVLSVDPQMIDENGGSFEIVVTATLDGKTLPEDTTVLLSIGPSSTAIRDVDYHASFRRLVIPADAIAGSTVLAVEPIDDAEVESDETIVLIGAVNGLIGDEAAIRIIDNDETPSTPITNPDRAVLVALYEATNGANWTNNTNWLSDRPLGEWYGVTTDENERVTRLGLRENRLSGSLPSSLGNLTNLQRLDLYDNELWGAFPRSLGNLTNLTYLNLGDNELSGSLPSSLGNLTNLQQLGLFDNKLSGGLPSSLGNLTRLEELWLKGNASLDGELPPSLVNLTNLQTLRLEDTQLCAPTDDVFQAWLDGIESKRGVRDCVYGEPSTAIVLSVNPQAISEDAGETEITVTATLDERALSEDTPVILSIGTAGTATRDVDYSASFRRLVIPADEIVGSTVLVVAPTDDAEVEDDETIVLIGAVDGLMGDEAAITIIDNDETPDNPDRAVLVALYEATNGDNWTNNTNWLSDRPLGEWYGVTTDRNGRVTRLGLYQNALSGSLPSSLGNLTDLQVLQLSSNELSGTLPSALGNLNNLREMWLQGNQFSGSLPSVLGDLTNLQVLSLYSNELSGTLPSALGNLTNLRELSLAWNQFSGSLPSVLGDLTNLERMQLHSNQLSGELPSSLGDLTNLEYLELGGNQFSGTIPESLGDLTNLQHLYLGSNAFSGELPPSLGDLTNLQDLNLQQNQLSGSLPPELVNLINLESLWLDGTQLCAPLDAGFQTWLQGIESKQGVVNCDPSGDGEPSTAIVLSVNLHTIREDEGEVPITVTATLDGRALSEDATVRLTISSESTAIRDVDYTASLRWPVIPAGSIAGSTTINIEPIDDDRAEDDETILLVGEVDGLKWDAVEITIIDDDESLDNPDRAVLVALYEATNGDNWTNDTNWLSDRPLGEWFGVATDGNGRVAGLVLQDNGLSGSIPSSLGNLSNLHRVWLNGNELSGSIPSSLGNLSNLQQLSLHSNGLSGSIPSSLGNLSNLTGLWLNGNELSGSIPSSLGNLSNLQDMELNFNELSGSIPSSLGNLSNLQDLKLYSNELSGSIPSSLGNLSNLQNLALGYNQLTGSIPSELGNLSSLQDLYLRSNQLAGSIPSSLGNLSSLQTLELSINSELSGPLPGSLIGLEDLNRLNIEDTGLCAPVDAAFQAWLGGILTKIGVVNCEDPESSNPDRAVLVALYEATNGDNWTNDTNWLSDRPLNEWFGVTTDGNGRVIRLHLFRNGVSGELPSSLGDLTYLESLGFYDNELSGALPSSLGNLTNLQSLDLALNDFSGSLPSSLGNLTHLTWLSISGDFSGSLPSWLGNLTNLHSLQLGGGFSGSLPSWLGNLTNLRLLGLSGNDLSGVLPSELGNLTNLQTLNLYGNDLSGALPSSLVNLTNLEELWLGNTQLCAPRDAAFQAWLDGIEDKRGVVNCGDGGGGSTSVTIPDANLRAVIEDSLGKARDASITPAEMASLTRLEAPHSNISDLTGLEYATSLNHLVLGKVYVGGEGNANSNQISDISPLSGLTNLTSLNLANNDLSDISPLSGLTNLTFLSLYNNNLSDISPLSGLTNLTSLDLAHNDISLSPLSNLTNLTSLGLESNRIEDLSPLSNLTRLTDLRLARNDIEDLSPLSNLTRLTRLNLVLNGGIVDISPLSNLTRLTDLSLGVNGIKDISPLSNLTRLTDLSLIENFISDLSPLVANTGLGDGDRVDVSNNPLSATSRNTHIPTLRDRGVEVHF